jgi:large subunit ribosomal protein L21
MKYAIIESGGKQYRAFEGGTIEVDRLPNEVGQPVELKSVLLLVDGESISVGTPTVKGAQVKAVVVEQTKGPKVVVFKYRPKKRYRVKTGHRQQYTRLLVDSILTE